MRLLDVIAWGESPFWHAFLGKAHLIQGERTHTSDHPQVHVTTNNLSPLFVGYIDEADLRVYHPPVTQLAPPHPPQHGARTMAPGSEGAGNPDEIVDNTPQTNAPTSEETAGKSEETAGDATGESKEEVGEIGG